jgi:predicted PurR-regulated permease PerM
VILVWILKASFNVLLLILAGVLIALYFHGLSSLINRKLSIPKKASLPISIIGSLVLLILFLWFAGDRIQEQTTELKDTLPAAFENFKEKINDSTIGKELIEMISSEPDTNKAASTIKSFFSSTFGVLGDLYVIFFLGIFFIASPAIYINGMLKLVPTSAKPEAKNIFEDIGFTLTKWLKGKIFSMFVVFVLTAIGLLILGVPLWFVLSLVAGLLSFVPNFGPILALIPAVLVGFMKSGTTALLVLGLYTLVQVLESNLITPKIQKKLINIPPALIITAQLFMGVLTGGWGLVLATPVVAIMIVLINKLYVEKQESK